MRKIFLLPVLFIACAGACLTSLAEVRLPAILGSHMVLQQNAEVKLWGWCEPGEKITIRTDWDTATCQVTGSGNAKWTVQVKTPAAGGPYKLTIKGNNSIVLEDVMIGEVWDCSGQSNMEMSYNWGVKQYTSDIENATNKNIRFFHVQRLTAEYPQDDTKGTWVVCNPEDLKRFSLVGFFFGQRLQQVLSVPVGLINASWGGTPAEAWTPKEAVENDPVLKEPATRLKPAAGWPINPGFTYNAMIHPIINFRIAGVLWYQGEANVGTASTYKQLLTTMIGAWRTAWGRDLPFYYVEIAPFAGYGTSISSALLREAQTQVQAVPNTGMVVVHDLVDDVRDIHPKNKKDVGLRLANYALAQTYGKKELAYKSPVFKSMNIEKDKIRIHFDNADNGLMSKSGAPTEFYIAGDDQKFMPATAKVDGNTVVVWNDNLKKPVAVRFGFSSSAMPNLFSKEGLPVNLFRTDTWGVDTVGK